MLPINGEQALSSQFIYYMYKTQSIPTIEKKASVKRINRDLHHIAQVLMATMTKIQVSMLSLNLKRTEAAETSIPTLRGND